METQVIFVDIFFRELEMPNIWGGCTENTSQQWKMVASFCEEYKNDFDAVLVNFCCYDCTNASEAVQKISAKTMELYTNSLKQLIL